MDPHLLDLQFARFLRRPARSSRSEQQSQTHFPTEQHAQQIQPPSTTAHSLQSLTQYRPPLPEEPYVWHPVSPREQGESTPYQHHSRFYQYESRRAATSYESEIQTGPALSDDVYQTRSPKRPRSYVTRSDSAIARPSSIPLEVNTSQVATYDAPDEISVQYRRPSSTPVSYWRARSGVEGQASGSASSTLQFREFTSGDDLNSEGDASRFICPHCNCMTQARNDFEIHLTTMHADLLSFVCSDCGLAFTEQGTLDSHLSSEHTQQKPFQCELCNATFGRKGVWKKHVQMVHEGQRKFECEFEGCQHSFGLKSDLKRHMQSVHLKQRPFECSMCNASFGRKSDLKRHMQSLHRESSDPGSVGEQGSSRDMR